MESLSSTVLTLLKNSLSDQSRELYGKFITEFLVFVKQTLLNDNPVFPCKPHQVTYYVAFLFQSGFSVSSIRSRVSAINYVQKLSGGSDLFCDFILKKCLLGLAKSHSAVDMRLPITLTLLIKLCTALSKLYSDSYFQALMKAMFSLAFVAFLRVGEITCKGSKIHLNLLHLHNISVTQNPPSLTVTFQHFKHNTPGPPFSFTVADLPHLPVIDYVCSYIKLRGTVAGPLFLHKTAPVSRNLFIQTLNQCLRFLNLNHLPYKSHSFRIGAATHAISHGASYEKVKIMGRWKSDALAKYIRVNSLQSLNVH